MHSLDEKSAAFMRGYRAGFRVGSGRARKPVDPDYRRGYRAGHQAAVRRKLVKQASSVVSRGPRKRVSHALPEGQALRIVQADPLMAAFRPLGGAP